MANRDPNIVTSDISSRLDLDALMASKGLSSVDCGCVFCGNETAALSAYFRSLAPAFSKKFYPQSEDGGPGCCIGGIVNRNGTDTSACLFPRIDGSYIDFDLAVWDTGNILSTIYHPTFPSRTSLSDNVVDQLKTVYALKSFSIQDLCFVAPIVYSAFECCKKSDFQLTQQ